MSTHKSSTTMGALVVQTVNWTKVLDEELATDIDNMDLTEEAEKHCKEEEVRQQKEAEAEQRQKDKERKQAAAAEARKWQWANSEVQASGSQVNMTVYIRCARLRLSCIIPAGVKKSKQGQNVTMRGEEWKKQAKKVAGKDNDNEIVILSSWKTKRQGGSKTLKEITDQWWGELIQAVSSCMDIANSHLEQIASALQSNGQKKQWHYMLMEGLVGQQQVLLSKLVEIMSTAGSGGSKEVTEDLEEPKEPQEMQGEGLGGQEETEGVPGGMPEDEPEDVLGNELENGTGAEDGTGEEAQKKDKGKGKGKAT
ncbi:hypothetical protein ID866_9945 [Astraeus odoratus]|nr:hypothetical protein ID866_9945 [Astraeus odoratus]